MLFQLLMTTILPTLSKFFQSSLQILYLTLEWNLIKQNQLRIPNNFNKLTRIQSSLIYKNSVPTCRATKETNQRDLRSFSQSYVTKGSMSVKCQVFCSKIQILAPPFPARLINQIRLILNLNKPVVKIQNKLQLLAVALVARLIRNLTNSKSPIWWSTNPHTLSRSKVT